MDTLADVVAAGRDREGDAVDAPDRTTGYSYAEFCTNAWKAGHLFRHYGVRRDATIAVVVGPKEPKPGDEPGRLGTSAAPLLALLGGWVLGAGVDLAPAEPIDARAVVLPDGWADRFTVAPGCSRIAYGGPPTDPDVAHFERELWSENPIQPPDPPTSDAVALRVETEYTHRDLLDAADRIASEHGLTAGDRVAVDAALSSAGAIAGGIVAPLSVGATVVARRSADAAYVVRAPSDTDGGADADVPTVDPSTVSV